MKKKLLLLTGICVLSAATLMGCGKDASKDSDSSEASVVTESSVAESQTSEADASESGEADAGKADNSEGSDSEYIGMTVNDFVAAGNKLDGYVGFGDEYEFYAVNEELMASYTLTLSEDATEIMENKDFSEDYEDLIGDCTITAIDVQYADDSKLQEYVGKTIADVEAGGITVGGYMVSMDEVVMIAYDGMLSINIKFSEEDNAIYETLTDPDTDDLKEAYSDCLIESIYYVQ